MKAEQEKTNEKSFYITTPLYYVNAEPHIGHAYTTLAADIIARYMKRQNKKVFLQTGTDEHGSNIEKTAAAKDISPKNFADLICGKFIKAWQTLAIEYDYFIRTTDENHEQQVQAVFEHLIKTGDIYPGKYEGLYCSSCENFYEKEELTDGLCPVHRKNVETVKEDTYFFRLSKYEKPLLKYYAENPSFLSPPKRAQEIINFVKSGLKDISVSRTKVSWGIPVRSNPGHTIYVWFDALLNYITGPGFRLPFKELEQRKKFEEIWPADIHLVGKEIYRFHVVIWPAMLMALNLPLPKKVFAHGWWTANGEKMSKSKGNFINPSTVVEKYGLDPFRYFIFKEVPFGNDGDFSFEMLEKRYNSDLANDLGNLFSRTMNLALKNLEKLPALEEHKEIEERILRTESKLKQDMENIRLTEYLNKIWKLISELNKKIDSEKPWEKIKTEPDKAKKTLSEISLYLIRIADWIYPFMPETSEKMTNFTATFKFQYGSKTKPPVLFPRMQCSKKP